VRANLFGVVEYPDGAIPGTNSLPPLVSQANVVTSRALLVTLGVINPRRSTVYCKISNQRCGLR
jgi:hypothetical protein